MTAVAPVVVSHHRHDDYAELKHRLTVAGLFAHAPVSYSLQVAGFVALYIAAFASLLLIDSLWLRLGDALAIAFLFTHLGYVGHDCGHRQVFASRLRNDLLGLGVGFLVGTSRSWWVTNHNAHHSFPNDLDRDPHTAIPTLAFSAEQRQRKHGPLALLNRLQAFYFFPMLLFEGFGIRLASVLFLTSGRARYPTVEALGMALHFTLYVGFLLLVMPAWQAGVFILVHQGVMGFYMGSVFAPNHKGMLIIEPGSQLDFLRQQVLTTRNLYSHPLTDFLYGGLNYQIEHHLFPNLPRRSLKAAKPIVEAFCAERGIDYYETGVLQSYAEIARYLHVIANPARDRDRGALQYAE